MANFSRINALKRNIKPDVILIEAGLNDLDYGIRVGRAKIGSFSSDADYVKKLDKKTTRFKTFVQAYVTMITRIRYKYPKAEIIVMLPEYSKKKCSKKIYNAACKELIKILQYYEIPYADMRPGNSGLSAGYTYFVDGNTHPNNKGFALMTEALQQALVRHLSPANRQKTVESILHGFCMVIFCILQIQTGLSVDVPPFLSYAQNSSSSSR